MFPKAQASSRSHQWQPTALIIAIISKSLCGFSSVGLRNNACLCKAPAYYGLQFLPHKQIQLQHHLHDQINQINQMITLQFMFSKFGAHISSGTSSPYLRRMTKHKSQCILGPWKQTCGKSASRQLASSLLFSRSMIRSKPCSGTINYHHARIFHHGPFMTIYIV